MSRALLMAALLAASGAAQAQSAAASPAKAELIARVLKLQQPAVEGFARSLTEQPAMQLMQKVAPVVQGLPPERREAVARDIEADLRKFVEDASPAIRERALKLAPSTIGTLLEERFNEDELKQILVMLESPVNKKFQAAFPDMQRVLGEKLVTETRLDTDLNGKLQALQQTVAKRLGAMPAASAPAPAPAKAGPASPSGAGAKPAAASASGAKK